MNNECPQHDCSVTGQDDSVRLLERYKSGDDSALEEIIRLYRGGLLYFINGYVHNITTAEDILSDTFLRLILSLGKYRSEASLKTYLYRIAANLSIDELRRIKRHNEVELESVEQTAAGETELESTLISDERSRVLHLAIEQLNDEYRRALFLFYFEELDCEGVAKVLHKSKKQTENILFRAKRALKVILEKGGFTYENLTSDI